MMANFNKYSTQGRHLMIDYSECEQSILNDVTRIEGMLLGATSAAKMNVIGHIKHSFPVEGVSCIVLIAESHLSIHTWPSQGYAAVDCYTCGLEGNPFDAHEYIREALGSKNFKLRLVTRGLSLFNY